MRIARYDGGRIGLVDGEEIVEVTDLSPVPLGSWPPVTEIALYARFDQLRPELERRLATGARVALASVRLESPVGWPHQLLAYPANYQAHREEMNSPNRADKNGFFLKATSSLSGPRDPIVLPELADREVHHECELAIVIGRRGRHVSREDALDHILGYSCLIDVTVRGTEERVMRKSYDTFTPLGPWIVTRDEIPDPDDLDLWLLVNGEVRQRANTRDLLVDVRGMIELATSVTTLEPGDVIATGTPSGVGPIRPGDEVRIHVAGVGEMTVAVVQGRGGSNIAFEYAARTAAGGGR
ncbi:5-oxopent-3-ene-1,2,5-tricarboxylate decarboxylase [Frankia canadensis]|uniref:5-oxopent-3-ene-1,2,5-tricarboxylate decarboxylase n=1 Tax=Frankia canadensis TaxID=1836972 RepID=A0A2I2KJH5_9ACTN|nr:fumarylacetoacetate hydrolase family protein [Frankia canadensis]SNQ45822.1 5-oxopent-3-ene-1,2,5-tricarboxylate decarboxylase [Frankia canadensis]SOU53112.1 5-oxopent-3-ene-1,2,5-tricarboxylate decarboxylase [Frankia canadensis]